MKIAIHSNSFDDRGCGRVTIDYSTGLLKLGHEVVLYCSSKMENQKLDACRKLCPVRQYDIRIGTQEAAAQIQTILARFADEDKVDFMHFLKSGEDDGVTPSNCKTGIHCVFNMSQPHGTVYAGVSEYVAQKFGHSLFVPHIIKPLSPTENLRAKLNIPKDALVFGRHGGRDTFNLSFVHQAIGQALATRPDLWFIFVNTQPFIQHDRAIFLSWLSSEQDLFNMIHTCDAMIHGRADGETFGLAIGEFSSCNKPVFTWSGQRYPGYDSAHLNLLGDKAVVYQSGQDLFFMLTQVTRSQIAAVQWDKYSERFSETAVMEQYKKVFFAIM